MTWNPHNPQTFHKKSAPYPDVLDLFAKPRGCGCGLFTFEEKSDEGYKEKTVAISRAYNEIRKYGKPGANRKDRRKEEQRKDND